MNVNPASAQPVPVEPGPGQSAQNPAAAFAAGQVVAFRNVSIAFDGPPVLEDVSFSIAPGETRILLGPAGVGKSVLLKLTNGLLRPDQGSILLFGEEISTMPEEKLFPLRTRTGMVFQEGALFDSLTVRDNVAYQLIQERVDDDEIDLRVRKALRFVELEETFDYYPASLSGGMKRRVAIARALIRQPELVLYDSPTGGLDPITSTTIIELVMKQRDVYRTPSLLVTHRLQDAFTLCSHRFDPQQGRMVPLPQDETDPNTTFLMLAESRLIFDGSLHELVHSENQFVREFLE
jgi:phospholipid/cholesterol/gamma-HCH transport system ATP-binding protein